VSEPVVVPSGAAAASAASPQWFAAARRAKALSWLSLVWMGLEGGIAVLAGILAGSIALIGFGIDSAIEGVASVVIIWRFTGARALSHAAEERAQKLVAIQFFILAPYVSFEAISALVNAEHPEISGLGMALTASSVIGMPLLGVAKQRVARTLGSQATHGEGTQNLLCAYLAAAVFLGLAGNALFGWWWLDPIAALFIAAVAVHEGAETWRGEGCCVSPVLTSASVPVDDDCCTEEVSHRLRTEGGDHIGVWVGDRRGANR
jgi:divalent metal cation (Fe/Co/Zn/Cd) transporter